MEPNQINTMIEQAAFLIAEENLNYEAAWQQAYLTVHPQTGIGVQAALRHCPPMPASEIKKAIIDYLTQTYGDEYVTYLRHLQTLAWVIMQTFQAYQPMLVGAAANDTATSESDLHLHLYTDEAKSVMLLLTNLNIEFETSGDDESEVRYGFDFNDHVWRNLSEPLHSQHLLPKSSIIFDVNPWVSIRVLRAHERFQRKKDFDMIGLDVLQKKLGI